MKEKDLMSELLEKLATKIVNGIIGEPTIDELEDGYTYYNFRLKPNTPALEMVDEENKTIYTFLPHPTI